MESHNSIQRRHRSTPVRAACMARVEPENEPVEEADGSSSLWA